MIFLMQQILKLSAPVLLTLSLLAGAAQALELQKVQENIWALVGPMNQRSPENLANNATFGVVVTADGVVLIDPGGSHRGAAAIDAAIQKITSLPVRIVINTGGQDHRWLGNDYWRKKGAKIIASLAAVQDQKDRADGQLMLLDRLLGAALAGTQPAHADIVFDERHEFRLGGVLFQLVHAGPAHTPGDAFVWIPSAKTVFTGDIVYLDRLLGIGPQSDSRSWVDVFQSVSALKPRHVVPGHGFAADMVKAQAETGDYLVNLRRRMASYIKAGGDILRSVNVDQTAFRHLKQFDALSRRNAQTVFEQMEWE